MSEPKSALVLQRTPSKKPNNSFGQKAEVEYQQVRAEDYASELSDEEKEA